MEFDVLKITTLNRCIELDLRIRPRLSWVEVKWVLGEPHIEGPVLCSIHRLLINGPLQVIPAQTNYLWGHISLVNSLPLSFCN